MKEIILIKNGELALKGLNRSSFEDMMIKNMRHRLSSLGAFRYEKSQSTITVIPEDENIDLDEAVSRLLKVFGIAALSRAAVCEKDIDVIRNTALEYLGEALSEVRTFKVEAKRADKKFPFTSPQICEEIGGWLLEHTPGLRVDVHNPDLTVTVEVREKSAFIRGNQLHGAGGMPVGSGGNAVCGSMQCTLLRLPIHPNLPKRKCTNCSAKSANMQAESACSPSRSPNCRKPSAITAPKKCLPSPCAVL